MIDPAMKSIPWPTRNPFTEFEKQKAHQDTKQMLEPTPELPDDTRISQVQFPTCILNALAAAGLRTVGKIREASDEMLLSLPDFGRGSVSHLRETLGLPSADGVRPPGKKPA
jgi:DNA-directed RNA polymerase alpha subunit